MALPQKINRKQRSEMDLDIIKRYVQYLGQEGDYIKSMFQGLRGEIINMTVVVESLRRLGVATSMFSEEDFKEMTSKVAEEVRESLAKEARAQTGEVPEAVPSENEESTLIIPPGIEDDDEDDEEEV